MLGKISFDDLSIEKLDDHHEITLFDCTNSDLNEFLNEKAHHQMKNKLNVTYEVIPKLSILLKRMLDVLIRDMVLLIPRIEEISF